MKFLRLLVAAVLVAPCAVYPADIEVAVGMTKFDKTNGVFYYDEIAGNDIDTRSPSVQLAVAETFKGQRFRFGYQYFGRVTEATSIYPSGDGLCHTGQTNCGTKREWYGQGSTQALFLQWEPSYRVGNWRLFADVGPMYVRARFQQKWIEGYDNYTIDSPNDDRWKWTGWAIGVEYKNVAIVYQNQPISSSSECAFSTLARTVTLRWRF